ncbi:multisubunit sodium/proton antiporter, MrpC subunit [Microbacterium hydrothermale]|uniref:Na(+)/H(+) antiporter subunit C n=1 Tax=Microbacterium hydrothermale TaxID=857427 RepID=UPI002227D87A|nr:Na(+)/H(+) antiporter subunit C [Microbacterium hydrothermale]MCW2163031.1 multisubunit sodium/proton antiporter, MrpC subunit [Microbacterium hydrothermale]
MNISLVLVIVMAVLFACGVYAMLERSLTRVLIGFLLLGNAANLLLLIVMGRPALAPFYDGETDAADMSDALPQALTLTAIVITFAISAFLLALIYRSWQLGQADTVIDDADDVALRTRTAEEVEDAMDEESRSDDDDVTTDFVGDVANPIRVLHQGDLSQLVDDAPVDRVAVRRRGSNEDGTRDSAERDGDAAIDAPRDPQDGDRS